VFKTNAWGRVGADFALHPLYIRSHAAITQQYAPDLHICFVPSPALDAYLPLAYAFTGALLCACVPVQYFTNTHTGRQQWLDKLFAGSLIRFVVIPGGRHVWALLAKHTSVWTRVDGKVAATVQLPMLS
jgi:hypothetical protein